MNEMKYYVEIGKVIKELRLKQNMTKTQLAQGICSISHISRIERGERCPSSIILRQITNKLGVNQEYLFRAIESSTSLAILEILVELTYYIERDAFECINKLSSKISKQNFEIVSLCDLQCIRIAEYISHAMITQNYEWGIKECNKILKLTYTNGSTPTSIEFWIMFTIGYLLLLNNQQQEAYNYLKKIEKYINKINFFNARAIVSKYYIYLICACLETDNLDEVDSHIEIAINYCMNHNVHILLRELYFLKGELNYRLNNKKEFEIWLYKALTLNNLIKNSDDDFFNTYIKKRFEKLQIKK